MIFTLKFSFSRAGTKKEAEAHQGSLFFFPGKWCMEQSDLPDISGGLQAKFGRLKTTCHFRTTLFPACSTLMLKAPWEVTSRPALPAWKNKTQVQVSTQLQNLWKLLPSLLAVTVDVTAVPAAPCLANSFLSVWTGGNFRKALVSQ